MGRSLGRFKISGVLIAICIGSFEVCIQNILDLGQEVFLLERDLSFIGRSDSAFSGTQSELPLKTSGSFAPEES